MKNAIGILAFIFVVGLVGVNSADAENLSLREVNTAQWSQESYTDGPQMAALQILLSRASFSVGVIDGQFGKNTEKAIRSFEAGKGLKVTGQPSREVWNLISAQQEPEPMMEYTITEEDAAGPYNDDLPEDYAKLAELQSIPYGSIEEMLAEKFHMDIDFLRAINAEAEFAAGSAVLVANVNQEGSIEGIERIAVRVNSGEVHGLNRDGTIVAHYPATVGSEQTPSPTGTVEVTAVAVNPTYAYKPDENFQQGDNDTSLTLPPGPNGPVGSVWIDLSKPTYGIHGSPDPALIDRNYSHGCVRLTNWDALELARSVSEGTVVEFLQE